MITVGPDTRISELISSNPDVIDAIASINPLFRKLKNPVLRRVLAKRVTISEAIKIGKCSMTSFATKIRPLGFNLPCFENIPDNTVIEDNENAYDVFLDVRPVIRENKDPFQTIIKALLHMREGGTLLLVNSFVPFPLIKILERKGYKVSVTHPDNNVVYTYITKEINETILIDDALIDEEQFNQIESRYQNNLVVTDVRNMPMPQPMQHILRTLQEIPLEKALFVYHKKIPMFLLPELASMEYKYVFKEDGDSVLMIIYKPG